MHISLRLTIFLIGFAAMIVGTLLGNIANWSMVDEVNKGRESGTEISQFGWNVIKSANVVGLYRSIHPNGGLLKQRRLGFGLVALGITAIVTDALFAK